jgi:hypothetical protein
MVDMHDWTLESIHFDWLSAVAELHLRSPTGHETVTARGVQDLKAPRLSPWGASASINVTDGPNLSDNGLQTLRVEMQSGDVVEVTAEFFKLP